MVAEWLVRKQVAQFQADGSQNVLDRAARKVMHQYTTVRHLTH